MVYIYLLLIDNFSLEYGLIIDTYKFVGPRAIESGASVFMLWGSKRMRRHSLFAANKPELGSIMKLFLFKWCYTIAGICFFLDRRPAIHQQRYGTQPRKRRNSTYLAAYQVLSL